MSGPAAHGGPADVIVVAAGVSRRMGGIDKLAWPIEGRPLLAHTIEAFVRAPGVDGIVIVTAPERRDALAAAAWLPTAVRAVVAGGGRRQDSVAAGFAALEAAVPDQVGDRVTLIHDGARPVVPRALIASVVEATASYGAAIPLLPVAETVKRVADGLVVATVDRSVLGTAQTPQGVLRSVWRHATAQAVAAAGTWTDEAALLEACRIPVHVIPGDPTNLKVTMPADLDRAAQLLAPAGRGVRTGVGQDTHPFGPGEPLRLGGIAFDGVPRLAGHSDGDVALHAVADALLGAAALGDLGRSFPADATTPAGIDSTELLRTVVGQLARAGWRPRTVDLTIVAARPRLAGRLDAIADGIASTLGVDGTAVSVKASTGNLDGSEGAGRAISALALATIEPAS